jgi:hypothetical protein
MRVVLFPTIVLFCSFCVLTNAASLAIPAELQSCLLTAGATQFGSTTILPDDPAYNETATTLIFNLQFSNRHPSAIVMVTDEEMIKKVLSCAR